MKYKVNDKIFHNKENVYMYLVKECKKKHIHVQKSIYNYSKPMMLYELLNKLGYKMEIV